MTDNEIIKALECCTDYSYESLLCRECPYFEYGFNRRCRDELSKDSLALINRQKAEIDGLNELVSLSIDTQNDFSNTIAEQKAEIERLKECKRTIEYQRDRLDEEIEELHSQLRGLNFMRKQIKSEALREVAERLKKESLETDVSYMYGRECWTDVVTVLTIDEVVKEMEKKYEIS